MANKQDSDKQNENFQLFTYTVNYSLNAEFLYDAKSIALKHVRNFKNKKFSINGEEAYVEAAENGVYFIASIPKTFKWDLNLSQREYENRKKSYDSNFIFSLTSWIQSIEEFEPIKPNGLFICYKTLCNLITLPFENEITHNMRLSIKLMNGRYKITGLKEMETKKVNNFNKNEQYWRVNLLDYATTSELNQLTVSRYKNIQKCNNIHALICNTINRNLNLYYHCEIDCFNDEETNLASNHIRITTLCLTRSQFETVRNLKNWNRNMNPYVLRNFQEEERFKILDIIYDYPRNTPNLINDWIKLFLIGTRIFYVFLVDNETGRTCEVLVIDRLDIESYLEKQAFDGSPYCFTAKRAINNLIRVLDWIKNLNLKPDTQYFARYNEFDYEFKCVESVTKNSTS